MKKSTIVTIILIAAAVVLGVIFISWYLRKATPLYIQGTVECTTYKASSKVPGRIEEMKVEEGQHVTKGELLYTLSTPELNAKLQQAEAVKSAASAMDQKALTGARIQQKEAALNLWENVTLYRFWGVAGFYGNAGDGRVLDNRQVSRAVHIDRHLIGGTDGFTGFSLCDTLFHRIGHLIMLFLFLCDFPYLKIGQGRRYGDVLSDSIYIQGLQLSGEIPF